MSRSDWCTIESDPGVFSELIEAFGVRDVQVDELYDLDRLDQLRPVFGLIFLFKWQKDEEESSGTSMAIANEPTDVPGMFFARQVIQNACATQAIVNILLNADGVDLGEQLNNFRSFTIDLPSDMRGLSLASADTIREAHNSFARPEPFVLDEQKPDKNDEEEAAFHFISYLPFNGNLYELDGLKAGPVLLASDVTEDNWLDLVRPAIQERIARYSGSEIRFNLMAVIGNRLSASEKRLAEMKERHREALARLNGTSSSSQATKFELPRGKNELTVAVEAMNSEIEMLIETIDEEKSKRTRWAIENARRKHNYIPFIFNLLQSLAEKGHLPTLIDKARAKRDAIIAADLENKKRMEATNQQ